MTQARPNDYWISPNALYIELNATGNPDYIQAACVSGAQILVYLKDIISYDAGHNYRRWTLQASPTVFNTHTAKYVYAAIPKDNVSNQTAYVCFPSEEIDIYGKNAAGEQIGSAEYYYIFLQGIISSSGDNGTVNRKWQPRIVTGLLSSDEAIAATGSESEWYKYSSVDGIVTFLKNLTMKAGTFFLSLFAKTLNITSGGKIIFDDDQQEITGIATDNTSEDSVDKIVTPKYLDEKALSSVHSDTAQKAIRFLEGLKIGAESTGCELTAEGRARLLEVIADRLTDSGFKSGASGFGIWKDEEGRSVMEVDRLTVRQTMTLLELAVEKIRSTGGQIVVSAANGTLKSVEEDGDDYLLEFEDACQFKAGDLARCQELTGKELRGYWVEVSEVRDGKAVVAKTEFEDGTRPKTGDELVLMGSRTDAGRRNLISIAATEDGQPRIDVMDGVKKKSLDGALRARLGNLDGITDTWFPTDRQPQGNGLYADNAYLRGTFLIENNGKYEDVKTRFEVTDGKIESAVEGVRSDLMEDRGYLDNPTFGEGRKSWTLGMDAVFFTLGSRWIWANGGPLTKKGNGATVTSDGGRTVVKIKNKYILQKRADMNGAPEIKAGADGKKEAVPVYLSFMCKVLKAGRLTVEFTGGDDTDFADYEHFKLERDMEAGTDYEKVETSGLWNSTGDFKLSFTGEINVTMLVLSTDRIESLAYTYRTLFEQSEKLVKISAAVFDKDEKALKETGLFVKPEGAGLYAQDADGKVALIGVSVDETDSDGNKKTKIKLTADNIQLEGLVTANENFKILEDGSIEAKNGKFTGEIDSNSGTIGGFSINSSSISSEGNYNGGENSGVDKASSRFFLYSSGDGFMGFSDKNRWVGIGLNVASRTLGVPILCRIENSTPSSVTNYGAYINVSGAQMDNIGLLMYGDLRANAKNYHSLNGTIVIDGSDELRVATDMESDGSYTKYYAGVSFDPKDYDLDKVRFKVRNGLIVGVVKE